MVAVDVEKNPRETWIFKTRVLLLTFPTLCCFFFPCSSFLQPVILLRRICILQPMIILHQICILQRGFWIWYFYFFSPCSTSSSPSFLVLHLHRHLHCSASLELESFKTQVPCGKNISMSAIRTQVFKAQFFRRTWASQAQDVILLISFQFLLTNYIVWQTNAILQITSK